MIKILLVIHAFIALGLIGVILLQRSDGGALGGIGGGGNFGGMLTGRSSANLLTRITAILATIFMMNSLFLAVLSGYNDNSSIVDEISNNPSDNIIIEQEKTVPLVPDSN